MYKYRYAKVIKKYNANKKDKKVSLKKYKVSLKSHIEKNKIKKLKKILSKLIG